jgi:hypothetical protein
MDVVCGVVAGDITVMVGAENPDLQISQFLETLLVKGEV